MTINPRTKGKRGEYAVRDILRSYGYKADRTPLSGAIDSWPGDITSNFPLFIEVKNTEKTTFLPWHKKAQDEAGRKRAVIIWTKNNADWFCFLKLTDLLDLLSGKPAIKQAIERPTKPKKLGPQDVAWQPFSKFTTRKRG